MTDCRRYTVVDRGYDGPGKTWVIVKCPYCEATTKCFVWSLAGSGKRCSCGALHSSYGTAPESLPG
jgi:hypothetical protein